MIQEIFAGLILMSISGLTFLAYKHHEGYKQLISPARKFSVIALIIAFAYEAGFNEGRYNDAEPFDIVGWALVLFFAFWILVSFLDTLPKFTKDKND